MTRIDDRKRTKILLVVIAFVSSLPAWAGVYQHGTVIRMRTVDCLPAHHGFMTAMGGAAASMAPDVCPEYTLLSDKVVYVIVGRSSDQLVPLADTIDFRISKNELAMRVDDARHESKFTIKEMVLRSEWDLVQKHITDQMNLSPHTTESKLSIETHD